MSTLGDVRGHGRSRSAHLPVLAQGVLVAVIALVARLAPVLRGGGLRGILGYDDGVYYSASAALLSGRVPYRDFLLLHPPGIALVLTPFAAVGRWLGDDVGLATGRVGFMTVGAASAVLVWLVGRRLSPVAGLTAGLVYAVWRPAVDAESSTLLEPLVNLGLLASLALLGDGRPGRRRLVAAGVVLGLAVAVKAWAVVPLLVLGVWAWHRGGRASAVTYLGSAAAAATAVCLPFLLLAGGSMWRMVVTDQLRRPDNGVSLAARVANVVGIPTDRGAVSHPLSMALLVAMVAATVVVALLARRGPATRLWVALLAATVAMLLASPSSFEHYGAFAAPPVALVAGALADSVLGRLGGWSPAARRAGLVAGAAALAVVLGVVAGHPVGDRVTDRAGVVRALAGARCVAADTPVALVVTDVLSRDLARGCPVVVDVTGLAYDEATGDLRAGRPVPARLHDAVWQRAVRAYFGQVDAVVVQRLGAGGLRRSVLRGLTVTVPRHRPHDLEVLVRAR